MIAKVDPTKFMHDKSSPSPYPPSLNAVAKFAFGGLTHIWEAKGALLRDGNRRNAGPPFINCHCFVPDGPHEYGFFPRPKRIPQLRPI